MDYTRSDAFVTDSGTGNRMHQDTEPVTTEVSKQDINMLIWELMEVVKAGGIDPLEFDASDPDSYTAVLRALQVVFSQNEQLQLETVQDHATLRDYSRTARFLQVRQSGARFVRLDAPLALREDNDGDYLLDDLGRAWQAIGRVADIRPDLPTVGQLMARAAQGLALKIGAIGDSTTDGALTTGHSDNPTSGIDPTWGKIPSATTDHTAESPNSFPAVLRQILRDRYANATIQVFNGGYGGQYLSAPNFWATHWFKKIFSLNANYGAPDLVLIGFGFNDANTNSATMVADFLRGLQALCAVIRGNGAVPVVMTPDVAVNTAYAKRQRMELAPAIRRWCRFQGVELIDVMAEAERYWGLNGRYQLCDDVADFVHPGDAYHGFKAGLLARELCGDIPRISASQESMGIFEPRLNGVLTPPNKDLVTDSRFAGNAFSGGFPGPITAIDAFVWVDDADYLGLLRMWAPSVPGATVTAGEALQVKVKRADKYRLSESEYIDLSLHFGIKPCALNYLADLPVEIGRLSYGLNRIRIVVPSSANVGYTLEALEFVKTGLPPRPYQAHAASNTRLRRDLHGSAYLTASNHLDLAEECHSVGQHTTLSYAQLGSAARVVGEFTGPVELGVNLLTCYANNGDRYTVGLIKRATGLHACLTNTGTGASTSLGFVAHPGAVPDTQRFKAIFTNGTDREPQIEFYYDGAASPFYTLKTLANFSTPVAGRIGGGYSLDASTTEGDVSYRMSILQIPA